MRSIQYTGRKNLTRSERGVFFGPDYSRASTVWSSFSHNTLYRSDDINFRESQTRTKGDTSCSLHACPPLPQTLFLSLPIKLSSRNPTKEVVGTGSLFWKKVPLWGRTGKKPANQPELFSARAELRRLSIISLYISCLFVGIRPEDGLRGFSPHQCLYTLHSLSSDEEVEFWESLARNLLLQPPLRPSVGHRSFRS